MLPKGARSYWKYIDYQIQIIELNYQSQIFLRLMNFEV